VIRDYLLPLGLDTNHGYGKTPVPNSESSKKRAALEKRLNDIKQWAPAARERSSKASLRYTRLRKAMRSSSICLMVVCFCSRCRRRLVLFYISSSGSMPDTLMKL